MADGAPAAVAGGNAADEACRAQNGSAPAGDAAGFEIALVPPCRFVVKATAGARIIGKRGESIKAIRAASNASVKVLQDSLPAALLRREECIVVASCGEAASLKVAISAILDRVFDRSGLPDTADRSRERPYVVEVAVPDRASAPLVGQGGEQIKTLIQELGCELTVVREPLAGIAGHKRVRVLARERERVEAGVWRLQEMLADFVRDGTLKPEHFELREALPTDEEAERQATAGEEIPVRILLAQGDAATVVGKMGANVLRLRDIAHVSIDNALAPFDPAERVCFIARASLPDRVRVVRLVLGDLCVATAARQAEQGVQTPALAEGCRPVSVRVLFPAEVLPSLSPLLLSGTDASGASIAADRLEARQNKLYSMTGATAWMPQAAAGGQELFAVSIEGTEDDVAAAVYRLHHTLESWEPAEPPPRYVAPPPRASGEAGDAAGGRGPRRDGGGVEEARQAGAFYEAANRIFQRRPAVAAATSEVSREKPGMSLREMPVSQQRPPQQPQQAHQPGLPESTPAASTHAALATGSAAQTSGAEAWAEAAVAAVEDVSLYGIPQTPQPQHSERPRPPALASAGSTPGSEARGPVPSTGPAPLPALLIALPSDSMAAFLASDRSGVAQRAKVKLRSLPAKPAGAGCIEPTPAALEVVGSAADVAAAAYFVQVHLWLMPSLGSCQPSASAQ